MCESHFLIGGREVEVISSGEVTLIGKAALQSYAKLEQTVMTANPQEEIPAEIEVQYGSIDN